MSLVCWFSDALLVTILTVLFTFLKKNLIVTSFKTDILFHQVLEEVRTSVTHWEVPTQDQVTQSTPVKTMQQITGNMIVSKLIVFKYEWIFRKDRPKSLIDDRRAESEEPYESVALLSNGNGEATTNGSEPTNIDSVVWRNQWIQFHQHMKCVKDLS